LGRVLHDSFARGDLIVASTTLIAEGSSRNFAWWEVAPNGFAVGRVNFGGGQAATEDLITKEQQEEITKIVVDLMGHFALCLLKSAVIGTAQWAAEPDSFKASQE